MPTLTRKYRLQVVGDDNERKRVYDYVRLAMDATYKSMNECMSVLYLAAVKEASKDDRKELNKFYSRQTFTKKESAFTKNIQFPEGLALAATVNRIAQQKFATSLKNGLMYGRVSLPTYKKDCAVPLHVRFVSLVGDKGSNQGIYHEYKDEYDLSYGIENDLEPKIFLKFPNNITFRFCFGNPYKSIEQRKTFLKIFNREYTVQGSSIQINKKGKIILNLAMDIPAKEIKHEENVIVGVDLGLAIPAMCALNNDNYLRCSIGNIDDFLRIRTKIQTQRRRLQQNLKYSKGGHGRSKKLQQLVRFENKEKDFAKTYNHMVSRRIVDFAVKNNASQINIEDLSGFGRDKNGNSVEDNRKKILRNWSYFELQEQIKYKAAQYGIPVRKVNPAYTSQTCSYCGELGDRSTQSKFICKNPECKSHKMFVDWNKEGYINADFNAARNIAMSVEYTDNKSANMNQT